MSIPTRFRRIERIRKANPYRRIGLGDAVHAVAHPIAKAVDKVAGTNLANCKACEKRRQALNRILPDLGRFKIKGG